MSTQLKKRIAQGHYVVEEVPYGRVYKWVPGCQAIKGKPLVLREDGAYQEEHKAYQEWLREEQAHPALKHYEWLELQGLLYQAPKASERESRSRERDRRLGERFSTLLPKLRPSFYALCISDEFYLSETQRWD